MDQPGSCQRALCECDLQLVKDLVSESNTWSKKNHQFYGFDLEDGCKADSAGMAGRSSILFFQKNIWKFFIWFFNFALTQKYYFTNKKDHIDQSLS